MVDYEDRLDNPRRCQAHRQRDMEPCGRWAMQGSNVCAIHGGKAPQVLAKARERLVMAADRMAEALLDMADESSSEAVKLNAIRDALDRAGITSKQEVSLELKPWEMLLQDISGIARISREEHRANPGRAIIDVDEVSQPDSQPDQPMSAVEENANTPWPSWPSLNDPPAHDHSSTPLPDPPADSDPPASLMTMEQASHVERYRPWRRL